MWSICYIVLQICHSALFRPTQRHNQKKYFALNQGEKIYDLSSQCSFVSGFNIRDLRIISSDPACFSDSKTPLKHENIWFQSWENCIWHSVNCKWKNHNFVDWSPEIPTLKKVYLLFIWHWRLKSSLWSFWGTVFQIDHIWVAAHRPRKSPGL